MTSSQERWVWRKSSYSEANGNSDCVEVAWTPATTVVRDSKNPDGGMLTIAESSWHAFRTAVTG
jgi:hypothetical protein